MIKSVNRVELTKKIGGSTNSLRGILWSLLFYIGIIYIYVGEVIIMKWWKTASVALGILAAIGFAGCGSEQAANNADSKGAGEFLNAGRAEFSERMARSRWSATTLG